MLPELQSKYGGLLTPPLQSWNEWPGARAEEFTLKLDNNTTTEHLLPLERHSGSKVAHIRGAGAACHYERRNMRESSNRGGSKRLAMSSR